MSINFKVTSWLSDGLVGAESFDFSVLYVQLWARVKAKKAGTCDHTGEAYSVGAHVYRPVGNASNRGRRVLAKVVDDQRDVPVAKK